MWERVVFRLYRAPGDWCPVIGLQHAVFWDRKQQSFRVWDILRLYCDNAVLLKLYVTRWECAGLLLADAEPNV